MSWKNIQMLVILFGPSKNLETWVLGVTYYYIQISLEILELHREDFIVLHQQEAVPDQRDDIMKLFNMFLIKQSLIIRKKNYYICKDLRIDLTDCSLLKKMLKQK